MIDQDDADFAPVIRVDRAGAVEHPDAVAERQTGPGAYLGLRSWRKRQRDAGRYQGSGARRQHDRIGDGSRQIHAGGVIGRVAGQRQPIGMGQTDDGDCQIGTRIGRDFDAGQDTGSPQVMVMRCR